MPVADPRRGPGGPTAPSGRQGTPGSPTEDGCGEAPPPRPTRERAAKARHRRLDDGGIEAVFGRADRAQDQVQW